MTPITVHVPKINDFGPDDFGPDDFDRLFGLWRQVNGDNLDVTFDFAQCFFLRQNAVAFLGGLIRLIEHRGGVVRMNWASLRPDVGKNLGKNGFRNAFDDSTPFGVGESIPFRQDLQPAKTTLINYLKLKWLGRGWVNVSPALRDAIVGIVYEIYANAFEHAQSPIGLFSCGQHFWRRKELKLSVVDFGVGIPSNVRQFARDGGVSAGKAMQWAFQAGTTTKPNGMGRGMGLELLKQFVQVNKGTLEMFSHEGYTSVSKDGEAHATRGVFFEGTLVNISLVCDDRHYILSSEERKGPLF